MSLLDLIVATVVTLVITVGTIFIVDCTATIVEGIVDVIAKLFVAFTSTAIIKALLVSLVMVASANTALEKGVAIVSILFVAVILVLLVVFEMMITAAADLSIVFVNAVLFFEVVIDAMDAYGPFVVA